MEHIDVKNSSESKLKINSICSIRIRSRKYEIFEILQQLNPNSFVSVLEVTEENLPTAWRRIISFDRQKLESQNEIRLSSAYQTCAGRK